MSLYYKIWIVLLSKLRDSIEGWWLVQVYIANAALNLMFLFAILQRNILHNTFMTLILIYFQ
jgi:hypothetical protein